MPMSTQTIRNTPVCGTVLLGLLLSLVSTPAPARQPEPEAAARTIQKISGAKAGLVVHVGCDSGRLTAQLHNHAGHLVQGLDRNPADVKKARNHISSLGEYGAVSARRWNGKRLPYSDDMVNLLVVENPDQLPRDEMLRVLAPHGVACINHGGEWKKALAKPWPEQIDEWPQYLHGADNNGVARDTRVGPPRHLRWKARPTWSRSHMTIPTITTMVSAGGRLFTIEDRATPENPFLPGEWYLTARNAFNGTVLWKHKFKNWEPATRYVKDIAVQLQRRLAAINGSVFCTPGLNAPVTEYDAASGRLIRTYQDTAGTREFAVHQGVLYLVTGDRMNAARYDIHKPEPWRGYDLGGSDPEAPFGGSGWRSAYPPETGNRNETTCSIVAMEIGSGTVLWKRTDIQNYIGATLAVRGDNAVYQTRHGFTCINPDSGKTRWQVEKDIPSKDGTEPNTVVLGDKRAYAQEGDTMRVYSLQDGSVQWTAPIKYNYEKSADLFLVNDRVWTGGSGKPTAYDPATGKRLTSYDQRMTGPMGHDRCYRNYITENYFINSKTGGADFVSLDDGQEFPNHWTRSTCGFGALPSNGLLYVGPYSCMCSIGAMAEGFNAYATADDLSSPDQDISVPRKNRLVKGPAYGEVSPADAKPAAPEDWPTYRHDGTRGAVTPTEVPAQLETRWEADLDTYPAAPVIADGTVFVPLVEKHTVRALDADDGSTKWEYTAGARVDSPPTYHRGLVLFGSRDGWVHCLRASDGALAWRFKDLPARLIASHGQLESPWPVHGNILVKDGLAYFAAGHSSFLDGGIVMYALEAATGQVEHRRRIYGPFQDDTGFPRATRTDYGGTMGFKNDIPVTDGERIYLRHRAFAPDLSDADKLKPHVVPTAGFTGASPTGAVSQHRTYWTISTGYYNFSGIFPPQWMGPWGDILATDGDTFYEVRGFPPKRHSYFDPRRKGYLLYSGEVPEQLPDKKGNIADRSKTGMWQQRIPLNGEAMLRAGGVLFLAGKRTYFPPDHPVERYERGYEGKLGGLLWAGSAKEGEKLASYELDAPPSWDGMAAARGRLYLCLRDGRVLCMQGE